MLILSIMCLMSVSCRSVDPSLYTLHRDSVAYTLHQRVDTLILCDTVYRHDSVIYRERTVLDTVYITKEVYRDRLHSTLNSQLSTLADTIVVTEYRDRVIEHTPERYVPKFYKWCTGLLWAIGLLAIGYWLLKWWLKCRV
jgi:hypothetical protein